MKVSVNKCKLLIKQSRHMPRRHLGESRYNSYSFTTSALHVGEWSVSHPGTASFTLLSLHLAFIDILKTLVPDCALPPGKGPLVPIVQEAGWAPEPVWTQRLEEKSFAPAGDRTLITQSSSL
jgi:hypothetical protein